MGVVTEIVRRLKPHPLEGGRRFKTDAERKAVMLERNRPEIPLEDQVEGLKRQVEAMQVEADHFNQLKTDMERLVLFVRENYAHEIARKEPQHQSDAVTAILHYAKIERAYRRGGVPLPS